MCVAVPCKLVEINGMEGIAESGGARFNVRLDLIDEPRVGNYVLVHAGFAIQQMDEETARETLALLAEAMEDDGGA